MTEKKKRRKKRRRRIISHPLTIYNLILKALINNQKHDREKKVKKKVESVTKL